MCVCVCVCVRARVRARVRAVEWKALQKRYTSFKSPLPKILLLQLVGHRVLQAGGDLEQSRGSIA